jgi:hypothetical protein
MVDRDLQPGFVGQFLQLPLPQPPARSVAASAVGANADPTCVLPQIVNSLRERLSASRKHAG